MARKPRKGYRSLEPLHGQLGRQEALLRLGRYLLPLWVPIVLAFVFTLGWTGINLGYGKLVKEVVDLIGNPKKVHSYHYLNDCILIAVSLFALRGFLSFGMQYSWAVASNKLTLRLRNEVFAHLQRLSIGFFDHRKTGQLMASLQSDIPAVTDVLDTLKDLISAPVVVVGGTVLLFVMNWQLAAIACIALPLIAAIVVRATRRVERYTENLQDSRARVLDIAAETLGAIRVVKSFGNEEHEIRRFQGHSGAVARGVLRTVRLRSMTRALIETLGSLALCLMLWVGGQQALHRPDSISPGGLIWFAMVAKMVADSARDIGQISVMLSAVGVAADRVFTLLDVKSEVAEKPDAVVLGPVGGRISFQNVDFAYSSGIPVLAGISFTMEPGEVVALVGPTGAGKTTVAALIPRFYDVTSGAITCDGIDLRDCTLKSLRDQIGIVPQDTVLFAGTLRDNIRYGRLDASDEELIAAAKTANAWEFIERLPLGLETLVGERGVMLSGGQRQRIAIARAVLRDPRILILDEATSSLDTQSEALVQDALQRLVKHRTTLVIAHRLSTVRNADKILVIQEGRIAESGRHDELMAREGIYSRLYQTQFRQPLDEDGDAPE